MSTRWLVRLREGLVYCQLVRKPTHHAVARLVESAVTRLLTDEGRDTAKQLLKDAALTF